MTTSATTLHLAGVERDAVTVGGVRTVPRLPSGLAARAARSAHESIARVVPATARPAILLDWDCGSSRLEPDSVECGSDLADELGRDIAIHRGREGGRLVVQDVGPACLNGWPLQRDVPHLLGHGDVIRLGDHLLAVRCDPPIRSLIEVGSATATAPPSDVATGFRLALEPGGEPFEMRCDASITRALLSLVLRHDPDRPFDPTVLGELERATLDWLVHRIADRVSADVFGSRIAIRPAAPGSVPDVWASAAVRVGSIHGAVWLGTSRRGLEAIAHALDAVARQQLVWHPAFDGIHVTLSARVDLGTVPGSTVATLAAGDVIAAREIDWLGTGGWASRGRLALSGAETTATAAHFEIDDSGRVLATMTTRDYESGGDEMRSTVAAQAAAIDEGPFRDALDAIGVVVAVEIARKRIRLSEALAISTGDVMDLGAPVSAGVSLLIDGAPIARGELVDVDGTLGVRIIATGGRR